MFRTMIALSLLWLSGCSYLEDYFPDKEKDYQYTSEIPLLNWPNDMRKNPANSAESAGETSQMAESGVATDSGPDAIAPSGADNAGGTEQGGAPTPKSTEITTSDDERNTIASVEIVKYDDGESRLRLGAPFEKGWRALSKAVTHNSIEVTERNHDQGLIAVQFDPNEKKAKDDSVWDELAFFFSGVDTNEQPYLLKLEQHDDLTDVLVLDPEHLPMLNNEAALRLLSILGDAIRADMAEKKTE